MVTTLAALLGLTAVSLATSLGSAEGQASAASGPAGSLSLVSQSPPWVQNASGLLLDVNVNSDLPRSELGLSIGLYSDAGARSAFQQTLTGNLQSFSVLDSAAIALTTPGLASGPNGSIELHLPVSAPGLPGQARPPKDGAVLTVPCTAAVCDGVYPLQVSLVNLNQSTTLDSFTTYLVLTPQASAVPSTDKLQFSWLLSVGSTPDIAPNGTAAVDAGTAAELALLAAELQQYPGTSLSVGVFGQLAEALGNPTQSKGRGRQAVANRQSLADLRALASGLTGAEVIPETYTPVDLTTLNAAGLSAEVADQLTRSRVAMKRYLGTDGHSGEFISTSAIGSGELSDLTASGVNRVVVPSSGVSPPPSSVDYTPMMPFGATGSGAEAIASYPGLDAHLTGSGDAALRANQLLADLAVIYFQGPNEPKAVALSAPLGWQPDAAFMNVVMAGLASSPVVHPTALSGLFDRVAAGVDDQSLVTRRLQPASAVAADALPSGAIAAARAQLAGLTAMSPPTFDSMPGLDDRLLLSETIGMSANTRGAYLADVTRSFDHVRSLLTLPFGHTITVTSLQAKVPLTIFSKATVPLTVRITVSSPDLGLSTPHSFAVTLRPSTNSVTLDLTARTSGDFPLNLQLSAPTGEELAAGHLTIRSTAISGVAVGLSIGAVAFLLVWWSRSILQRRRKKHKLRGAALAASVATSPAS